MYSLSDWKTRFPKIQQRARFWCIPASIENVLRYSGIQAITQEDLVLGYCKKFGDQALVGPIQRAPVSIRGLDDTAVLQLAMQCAFTHGNFETFAEPARQSPAFQNANLLLRVTGGITSSQAYFSAITRAIQQDCRDIFGGFLDHFGGSPKTGVFSGIQTMG